MGVAAAFPASASPLASDSVDRGPQNEAYWAGIAAQYDVTREIIQLENGNWGVAPRTVLAAYQANIERVNRDSSYYARRKMAADLTAVQSRLADFLKVNVDEVVFTRNATEALKALIGGYNKIKPGDSILYANLDYGSMQAAMAAIAALRGARLVKIALPEPANRENVIAAYTTAFNLNPDLKLILLTHVSHRTGLLIPVKEIADSARARSIDVILDAAHSLGQVDFVLPDLGVDFVGMNLHKWIGAPLGVGAMYIKRNRIADVDPDIADENPRSCSVTSRVHTGTVNYAALLTVPDALGFQESIGSPAVAGRLRALRNRWVHALKEDERFEILTPDDSGMHGGITSFRFNRLVTDEGNRRIAAALLAKHGIFTVHRTGVASGSCVRVTPALFNSMAEMDRLVAALRALTAEGPI